ncbi:hypothetical protein SDC9_170756 [bioreactor metagenome]|uniref:Uncharacterized protein n=1 Tax=bioreactor metagenome TaxID=1076179 RepID=A0A645G8Z3_9ZZZZ
MPISTLDELGAAKGAAGLGIEAIIAATRVSISASWLRLSEDFMLTVSSISCMFFISDTMHLIRPPAVGAQEPFSIKATVLF